MALMIPLKDENVHGSVGHVDQLVKGQSSVVSIADKDGGDGQCCCRNRRISKTVRLHPPLPVKGG